MKSKEVFNVLNPVKNLRALKHAIQEKKLLGKQRTGEDEQLREERGRIHSDLQHSLRNIGIDLALVGTIGLAIGGGFEYKRQVAENKTIDALRAASQALSVGILAADFGPRAHGLDARAIIDWLNPLINLDADDPKNRAAYKKAKPLVIEAHNRANSHDVRMAILACYSEIFGHAFLTHHQELLVLNAFHFQLILDRDIDEELSKDIQGKISGMEAQIFDLADSALIDKIKSDEHEQQLVNKGYTRMEAKQRSAAYQEDPGNYALLFEIEPAFREQIEAFAKILNNDAARTLSDFYRNHGKLTALTGANAAAASKDDFSIDVLKEDGVTRLDPRNHTERELWFFAHGIPYYDSKDKHLRLPHLDADAGAVHSRSNFRAGLVWMALFDAYGDLVKPLPRAEFVKLFPPNSTWIINLQSIGHGLRQGNLKSTEAAVRMLEYLLQLIFDTVFEKNTPQIQIEQESIIYAIARLLEATAGSEDAEILPYLRDIAAHPEKIRVEPISQDMLAHFQKSLQESGLPEKEIKRRLQLAKKLPMHAETVHDDVDWRDSLLKWSQRGDLPTLAPMLQWYLSHTTVGEKRPGKVALANISYFSKDPKLMQWLGALNVSYFDDRTDTLYIAGPPNVHDKPERTKTYLANIRELFFVMAVFDASKKNGVADSEFSVPELPHALFAVSPMLKMFFDMFWKDIIDSTRESGEADAQKLLHVSVRAWLLVLKKDEDYVNAAPEEQQKITSSMAYVVARIILASEKTPSNEQEELFASRVLPALREFLADPASLPALKL